MTSRTPERRIVLAGASNFRDVGGYETQDAKRVRWRRVFRADALHDLTPEDVDVLATMGLGDVFDLRTARELEVFAGTPLATRGVRHHHVPFVPEVGGGRNEGALPAAATAVPLQQGHQAHAERYLEMLEGAKPAAQRVLAHVAETADACVFHCTGGRDRTGLTAALLLSVLGVPRTVIAADYALTTQYLVFSEQRLERMRALFGERVTRTGGAPATHAEVMTLTLEGLDARYGSPAAYLEDAGVTSDHQQSLCRALLEP